ncbi:aspartate 1-decarboxylase [bacterium]|nr:aspartate 1-decarboxylase [Actinomycetota bacterium]MBE33493.1 aspartate 1-decarboxylase [bacterium]|tara:strand:- start:11563 stop:11892 length:330 start_codon:yes stop_codon:yes gene_type:complete
MQRTVLKSKIAYAVLTDANLYYEGSIGIDHDIMDQANIIPNEQVQVVNVNNGERLVTYAIPMERGSMKFVLNGPAARKGLSGDEIVIISYIGVQDGDVFDPIIIDLKHD